MAFSVAIVGAGPSGCYLAQALAKSVDDAQIDVIDRLPTPYGLIRYGVAPDHQGTKAVIRQFERLFERQGVAFFGNVTLGVGITLAQLRDLYDVVVLATGLDCDRQLGIVGEDLAGVMRAGAVTRWLNDHPLGQQQEFGSRVVIVGNGNVAIDLVRLLAKSAPEFDGSDLGLHHLPTLVDAGVTRIDVVGRSPASQAKFDPVMVKELAKLANVGITVIGADGRTDDPAAQGRLDALAEIDGHGAPGAAKQVVFHFGWTPAALEGEGGALQRARFTTTGGADLALDCDTVITAIGFEDDRALGRAQYLSRAADAEAGCVEAGLYLCGWFRRGPRGTIPENRADAIALAARIAADRQPGGDAAARPGRAALRQAVPDAVSYEGWQRINAAEIAAAPPTRCRQKIVDHQDMLALARGLPG